MTNKTYSEKLTNPKWQKKRLEVLSRDNFKCQLCGDEDNMLHVHHKEYKKGCEPWEYDNSNFISLCKDCHREAENAKISECKLILVSRFFDKEFEQHCTKVFYTNKEGINIVSIEISDIDKIRISNINITEKTINNISKVFLSSSVLI